MSRDRGRENRVNVILFWRELKTVSILIGALWSGFRTAKTATQTHG